MNQSQNGFKANISSQTLENTNYRQVLFTGKNMQLVLMSLLPNEEIGMEVHNEHDQFFRVEQGKAKVIIDGEELTLEDDDAAIVPAGKQHNVINIGEGSLKLYTIYAPPEHPDGKVQARKED